MNFERLEYFLRQEFGDSAAEAVYDAINYYLLNNNVFPSESDKLVLLMMLNCTSYAIGFHDEHNAVRRFTISFSEPK